MTTSTSSSHSPPAAPAAQPESPPRVPAIVGPGEGQPVNAFGSEILFKLVGEQTGGALTVGLATVQPGGGPPPHVHHVDDEMFLIVEGMYRISIDGRWSEVGPGSIVYLPRGCVHTFQVVGPAPGRHWVLLTPSGFERFYARCAEVFAAPGPPDRARLAAINAEHGYDFVAPPGGEPAR
jgi:quercetin dioxygenase-like cupin family protein